ncbi:MAG: diadenylate cyclase CdaA [Chitinophagales bacterium]
MLDFFAIHIGFLEFRFLDFIDIFLVAILLFYIYRLVKGSIAFNIFIGIAFLYMIWYLVKILDMKMLSTILGQFIELGVLAFVILFQPEIRRFLLLVGKGRTLAKNKFFNKLFQQKTEDFTPEIESIATAMKDMSETKTGALIVITRSSQLQFIASSGIALNADISAKLIESIFEKNAPLHDGAILISENKITAAGCTLPLSEKDISPKRLGTRHRAALGISEQTDAVTFIVSEETGNISVSENGNLDYAITENQLKRKLKKAFTTEQ